MSIVHLGYKKWLDMIYCYSDVPINILNVLWYGTICGMGQSENLSCMLVLIRPVAAWVHMMHIQPIGMIYCYYFVV